MFSAISKQCNACNYEYVLNNYEYRITGFEFLEIQIAKIQQNDYIFFIYINLHWKQS